jgi:hypothetical protein
VRGQLRDVRVPAECPPAVEQLIAACINSDVAARPSSQEVVARLVRIIEDGGGCADAGGDTGGARCASESHARSSAACCWPGAAPPRVSRLSSRTSLLSSVVFSAGQPPARLEDSR